MRYVEAYEQLVVLDAWHDDGSDDLIVLTGEANGQVWRHHIDRDGVETWRKPDDDAAAAVLHGEQLFPGTLAAADAADFEADPETEASAEADERPFPPPADSLLAKADAYVSALSALHDAGAIAAGSDDEVPDSALQLLRELPPALEALKAAGTVAEIRMLQATAEVGGIPAARFVRALAQIEMRLMHEMASISVVTLTPSQWRLLVDPSPFGSSVGDEFPDLAYDMEEAAQCLALRRPTASAFHAIRIVERSLEALSRSAGVELLTPDRQWSRLLDRLRALDRPELAGVATGLAHVRRWSRGARLMPGDKYTEAEAERLFHAVGAFLREVCALSRDGGRRGR